VEIVSIVDIGGIVSRHFLKLNSQFLAIFSQKFQFFPKIVGFR
jgi:hypothetical protein